MKRIILLMAFMAGLAANAQRYAENNQYGTRFLRVGGDSAVYIPYGDTTISDVAPNKPGGALLIVKQSNGNLYKKPPGGYWSQVSGTDSAAIASYLTPYLKTSDWQRRSYRVDVPYGIGVVAFGNSIVNPGSAASPVDSSFNQRLVDKVGGTFTNRGNFGASISYTMYQINRMGLLLKTRGPLATLMNGINDIRFRNTIQALNRQLHGARVFAVNCLYDTIRAASTLSEVGTWSNSDLDTSYTFRTIGRQTSTAGDYATFNSPTDNFFIVFGSGPGTNYSDSVRITAGGILVGTVKLSAQIDTTFPYVFVMGRTPYINSGGIVQPYQVRIINADNKPMKIDYVGYLRPKNNQVPGLIFDISTVSDSARTPAWGVPAGLTNGWFDTVNTAIANDNYENFTKFGHKIVHVYSNDGFDANTMTQNPNLPYPSTDGIHPLNIGHRLFFQAAERAINVTSFGNVKDSIDAALLSYYKNGGNVFGNGTDTVTLGTTTNAPVKVIVNGTTVAIFSATGGGREYINSVAERASHLNGNMSYNNGGTTFTRANQATSVAYTFADLSSPSVGHLMDWATSYGTHLRMQVDGRLSLGRGTTAALYGLHLGRTIGVNKDSLPLNRVKGTRQLNTTDSANGQMGRYPLDSLTTPWQADSIARRRVSDSLTANGYVTIATDQTITSVKTLSPTVSAPSGVSYYAFDVNPTFSASNISAVVYGARFRRPTVTGSTLNFANIYSAIFEGRTRFDSLPTFNGGISVAAGNLSVSGGGSISIATGGSLTVNGNTNITGIATLGVAQSSLFSRASDATQARIQRPSGGSLTDQLLFMGNTTTTTNTLRRIYAFRDTITAGANTPAAGLDYMELMPNITQTGFTGQIRGLRINPGLTGVTDFRGLQIDVSAPNSYAVYLNGTAPSTSNGLWKYGSNLGSLYDSRTLLDKGFSDSAYIGISGNQSIAGVKTFSGQLRVGNPSASSYALDVAGTFPMRITGAAPITWQNSAGGLFTHNIDNSTLSSYNINWRAKGGSVAFTSEILSSPATTTVTGNYTATANDYLIPVNNTSGATTITLPSAAANPDKIYIIKNLHLTNTVNISGMEASETSTLAGREFITVWSNGTSWYQISGK